MPSCSAFGCTYHSGSKDISFSSISWRKSNKGLIQHCLHNVKSEGRLPFEKSFDV